MLSRISSLRITGLITEPNEYGTYAPGACKVAHNVLFRDVGIVDTATDVGTGYALGVLSRDVILAQPLTNGSMLWLCQDVISGATTIIAGQTNIPPGSPLTTLNGKFDPVWVKSMVMRDRIFLNGTNGVYCIDSTEPDSTAKVRRCGLAQPHILGASQVITTTGGIVAGTNVGYRAVTRKKIGNYEIVSPPSYIFRKYYNQNFYTQLTVVANALSPDDNSSYLLDIYRSAGLPLGTTLPVDWHLTVPNPYNRVFQKDGRARTSGTGVVAGQYYHQLTDYQGMTAPYYQSVGTGLYTDDSNEGALAINFAPPACKVMGSWNDQAFYGNITDTPQISFQIPGGIGTDNGSADADWYKRGIGWTQMSITRTGGSPDITVTSNEALRFSPGQLIWGPGWPAGGVRVLSVNGTTITMDQPATTSGTGDTEISDMMMINGQEAPLITHSSISLICGILNHGAVLEVYASPGNLDEYTDFRPVDVTIRAYDGKSFTIKVTNGSKYSPPLPEWDEPAVIVSPETRPNVLKWSKPDEPEAVPLGNSTSVGSGEILAFESTKDSAFVFCSDGIYQLIGYSDNFQLILVAKDYIISSPRATCSMLDRVFAITNRGLIEVTSQGITELSSGIFDPASLGSQYSVAGPGYQETSRLQLHADPTHLELILLLKGADSTQTSQLIVYNVYTKTFSTVELANSRITALGYNPTTGTPGEPGQVWVASRDGTPFPKVAPWQGGPPLDPTILLQPFYGRSETETFTSKKWTSVEWLWERPIQHPMVVGYYDTLDTPDASGVMRATNDLSKIRLGVPRRVARRTSISPGIHIPDAQEVYRLKGVSVQYHPISIKGDE